MSNGITQKVKELAQPIAKEAGFQLAEVEYKKEGQDWFLRIFLDATEKPVDLDVCAFVSERLSKILDEMDFIPDSYFLDVSSRGTQRKLKKEKDLSEAIGENVHVSTYGPINGEKIFKGILSRYEKDAVTIKTDKGDLEIPTSKVANIRLDDSSN